MKTSHPKPAAPQWILVDAAGKNLGRMAATVATVLRGKHRASFSPHMLCGDHVVVINASKLEIHPTKYRRTAFAYPTGHLGNLKRRSLEWMMENRPTAVIENAVSGMLRRNRLRNEILKRLHVYADEKHKHEAQKPVPLAPHP